MEIAGQDQGVSQPQPDVSPDREVCSAEDCPRRAVCERREEALGRIADAESGIWGRIARDALWGD